MTVSARLHALLSRLKTPQGMPGPGLFHYTYNEREERSRIHLRIDPDHSGLLLVNANRVVHLNPTAAFMAHLVLEQIPREEALRAIRKAYSVPAAQAEHDYTQICDQIGQLIRPDGACPVCELDVEITAPFTARPSAPYRMDLALTYRCNNDCPHCYNARPRSYPELPTTAWYSILDRLWEIGIPHVVFTGGEATLRDDLPELIAYAERNGQITGLNTNARRLSDKGYVERLVDAGLDHVQITVESHDAQVHDKMVALPGAWKQTIRGLRNVLDTPLYVMTNTTMLQENSPTLRETLDFLAETGVPTVGLNALIYAGKGASVGTGLPEKDLPPLLETARERTGFYGQRLIWYTPTQYCNFDPMQLELGVKGCTAALYNMCVEPDGKVIPCQSYYAPLGTLPDDPWEAIWNHPLSVSLRERRYVPAKCSGCALLAECGGGCPLMNI
jgi:radical SAM protein with 4Fe4S-binding SPASM domain